MRPRLRHKKTLPNRIFLPRLRSSAGMSFPEAQYHPLLFSLMCLSALAELGLTAFLVYAGNAHGTWPSALYHSLLIFLLFCATWTVVFSAIYILWLMDGATHILANIASSIFWLGLTLVLWGVAAGVFHFTRTGGNCPTSAPISRCRQSLTVECLAWVECGISAALFLMTCFWAGTSPGGTGVLDSRRMV
ncbi:hypothetical protein C8F01DRAFT_407489 [Mycena amicta]|nr:hypothetical protein C8F01DRAFT_407489 [Mycena amicta]